MYEAWSTAENTTGTRIFSRSTDGGLTWSDPISIPQTPYWGTLDVGPRGELFAVGWNGSAFFVNRSRNATNRAVAVSFDLTRQVNLGGSIVISKSNSVNPDGLIGQAWIAVDRSVTSTRGNVYVLCSVADGTLSNPADVIFIRSTNGGSNWSAPRRINDDARNRNAWHWFGTLAVAPNGRIDVCWYDTRGQTNNLFSALYYSQSTDGGLTWSSNRAVSPPFNHTLGYPMQRKIGDYIGMVSLNDATCIAYTATFNGEQDIYFRRIQPPVIISIAKAADRVTLTWSAVAGHSYCVQFKNALDSSWTNASMVGCVTSAGSTASIQDVSVAGVSQRFYRVVEQP
jgi:Neuraminidase (sialidase)